MSQSFSAESRRPLEGGLPAGRSDILSRGAASSKGALWAGRVMSGFAVLFLTFDAAIKVLELPMAVTGTTDLGYPASVVLTLGLIQVACLVAYLIPRTSVLGAVFWTAYLGGAVATHVRVGNPLFTHTLFPVYIATLLWLGLWLRDPQLRSVLPTKS